MLWLLARKGSTPAHPSPVPEMLRGLSRVPKASFQLWLNSFQSCINQSLFNARRQTRQFPSQRIYKLDPGTARWMKMASRETSRQGKTGDKHQIIQSLVPGKYLSWLLMCVLKTQELIFRKTWIRTKWFYSVCSHINLSGEGNFLISLSKWLQSSPNAFCFQESISKCWARSLRWRHQKWHSKGRGERVKPGREPPLQIHGVTPRANRGDSFPSCAWRVLLIKIKTRTPSDRCISCYLIFLMEGKSHEGFINSFTDANPRPISPRAFKCFAFKCF